MLQHKRFLVSLPENMINLIDMLGLDGGPSRNKIINIAVNDWLKNNKEQIEKDITDTSNLISTSKDLINN